MYRGYDISKWNENPDIKDADFVIIRAGYGQNHIDPRLHEHVDRCIKLGIPFGLYWFSYATCTKEVCDEARYCYEAIQSLPVAPEYPIYFDFEEDSERYFRKVRGRDITKAEFNTYCKTFCDNLEAAGYYAGIYVNKSHYAKLTLGDRYTIWLADYSDDSFDGRRSSVHMIQTGNKPIDTDVCRINFPSVMIKAGLNHVK